MNHATTLRRLAIASATLLAISASQAATFSKAVYAGAKDDIKASYTAEREACNVQSGNAKDICVEAAKAHEKIAMAQLEFNYSGKASDEVKLYQARYEGAFDIAKERCDDLSGNGKDVCVREAKSNRDKAKADLKLAKKVSSATDDAISAHMKADYKLAREKCDALAGDAKDICVASAKARYQEAW